MITDTDVINAMVEYGGSFVSALGKAAQHADPANLRTIKTAFAPYWANYAGIAEQMQQARAAEKRHPQEF